MPSDDPLDLTLLGLKSKLPSEVSIGEVYEFITAPIASILDQYFESGVLKTTLASDGVIGALCSPYTPGSSYVLLHHVMGEVDG